MLQRDPFQDLLLWMLFILITVATWIIMEERRK